MPPGMESDVNTHGRCAAVWRDDACVVFGCDGCQTARCPELELTCAPLPPPQVDAAVAVCGLGTPVIPTESRAVAVLHFLVWRKA